MLHHSYMVIATLIFSSHATNCNHDQPHILQYPMHAPGSKTSQESRIPRGTGISAPRSGEGQLRPPQPQQQHPAKARGQPTTSLSGLLQCRYARASQTAASVWNRPFCADKAPHRHTMRLNAGQAGVCRARWDTELISDCMSYITGDSDRGIQVSLCLTCEHEHCAGDSRPSTLQDLRELLSKLLYPHSRALSACNC